jgi:hypothetical protein
VRIRLSLTLDVHRDRPAADDVEQRDTQLDAYIERGDPHPEYDRPIGFRRSDE